MKTYKCIIKGRVQGVWYRKYTIKNAKQMGICGYVKNLPNGNVVTYANIQDIDGLELWIEKLYDGSPFSKVQDVTCAEVDYEEYEDFEQRI